MLLARNGQKHVAMNRRSAWMPDSMLFRPQKPDEEACHPTHGTGRRGNLNAYQRGVMK
jgi:hypothetical protein